MIDTVKTYYYWAGDTEEFNSLPNVILVYHNPWHSTIERISSAATLLPEYIVLKDEMSYQSAIIAALRDYPFAEIIIMSSDDTTFCLTNPLDNRILSEVFNNVCDRKHG